MGTPINGFALPALELAEAEAARRQDAVLRAKLHADHIAFAT